jgi:nucleotide-binding universal stress UspA family protein
MFSKILHANDGSEVAFHALSLAIAIAKQNNSELHMVSVEEIPYLPEFIEEVREVTGTAARHYHAVFERARDGGEGASDASYPSAGRSSRAGHRPARSRAPCRIARHLGDRPLGIV